MQKKSSAHITIGEASKLLGVSIDTLRRWEKKGKISPIRNQNQVRLYSKDDILRLKPSLPNKEQPISNNVTIGKAAEALGVSIDTLRRWEKKGKINSVRNAQGVRIYDISSFSTLAAKTSIALSAIHNSSNHTHDKPVTSNQQPLTSLHTRDLLNEVNQHDLTSFISSNPSQLPLTASQPNNGDRKYIKLSNNRSLNLARKYFLNSVLTFSAIAVLGISALGVGYMVSNVIPGLTWDLYNIDSGSVAGMTNSTLGSNNKPAVLQAATSKSTLQINTDTEIKGTLTLKEGDDILTITAKEGSISFASGESESALNLAGNVSLDQDVSTTASPTFNNLTLTGGLTANTLTVPTVTFSGTSKQIVLSTGKTITLQDTTDTLIGKTTTDTLSNKTLKSGDSNIISGAFPDITGITSLGTVSTGTWNGTKIDTSYGGTGLSTYTTGDLLYSSAANTLKALNIGTASQILTISNGIPAWGSLNGTSISSATLTGTTVNGLTITNNGTNTLNIAAGKTLNISNTFTLAGTDSTTMTFPSSSGTVTTLDATQTLTNKSLTSPTIGTSPTASGATWSDLGTVTTVDINGGTLDGVTIGGSSAAGGTFTTLAATSTVSLGSSAQVSVGATGGITVAPTGDSITALTLRATSGSGSPDIFNITNAAGDSSYLSVSNAGSLTVGGNTFTATGNLAAGGIIQLTGLDNAIVGTAIAGGWTMNSNTFTYRRGVTVTNNDGANALPANYEVTVTISGSNASQIYNASQSDYDDVRISYGDTEIAKNVTSFTSSSIIFTFQLQAQIAASGSDATYYIYYGNSALDSAGATYTGNIAIESADATTNWATSDSTQFPLAIETSSPAPQEGTGSLKLTATVDNIGTFATTNQGQLSAARTNFGFTSPTISSTRYLYVVGGSTDGTAANAQTTVLRTSVAAATGHVGSWTTNANSLSSAVIDNTVVAASPPIDGGTGADGAIDLTNGSGAGGCTGTGLSWDAGTSTCTIATATKSTFNFTTITIPEGTTLTTDGPKTTSNYLILKATGTVTIAGTINLAGKGYSGGGGQTVGYGPGAGNGNNAGGCGAGYGGAGGAGGGGIKISSSDNITASGTINTNGATPESASNAGGGGSGGRIYLMGSDITASGSLTANGGNGGDSSNWGAGGGGGGRITLEYTGTLNTTGSTITVSAGNGDAGSWGNGANGSAGVSTNTQPSSYLYSLGGKNTSDAAQSAINYATISSSDGSVGAFSASGTSLPQALFGHVSTVLTISSTNYLYVIGGNNGTTDQTTVYKGTFNTDGSIASIATTSQTQLGTGISYPALTNVSISDTNYIYVIGGLNGSTAQTSVYKGTVDASGNITALTTASQGTLPVALYGASAFVGTVGSNNYLYVIGGKTTGGTRQTVVYKASIDASGNVGTFTTDAQTQLSTATSNHASFNFTDNSSNQYTYLIGGNTAASSALTTVNKATYTPIDQTTYSVTKTLASSINMSNKNDIQFKVFTPASGGRTGQYLKFEVSEDNSTWRSCDNSGDFNASSVMNITSSGSWQTIVCKTTGLTSAQKDALLYLKYTVNSSSSSQWLLYIDDVDGVMNATTVDNATSGGAASMGAANLDLNAQGTGAVRLNYDATNGFAGTGGLALYNGGTTSLFSVNSAGSLTVANISASGTNNYGMSFGTLTGGTSTNYQITTGTLTSIASSTSFQQNLGAVVGASSATFGAIKTGAISGTGTASYGLNLGANSSTATTNYGINIGAISGAGTNNYGLYIGAVSGAGTGNFALFTAGGKVQFTCTTNNLAAATDPNCSDYAEVYDTNDSSLEAGDLIIINDKNDEVGKVAKSTSKYQKQLIGVYSTSPGMLIGYGGVTSAGGEEAVKSLPKGKVPVALSGRVPVKVSTESGTIKAGDYLTSSSTPGVAMKATRPGQVIGKALESFSCSSPQGRTIINNYSSSEEQSDESRSTSCQGKILAFINPSFADPNDVLANLTLDESGNLTSSVIPAEAKSDLAEAGIQLTASANPNSNSLSASSKRADKLSLLDPDIRRDDNVILSLKDQIASLSARLFSLESRIMNQESTSSSVIASDEGAWQSSTSSASISSEDSSLISQNDALNLTPPELLLATGSARLDEAFESKRARLADLAVTSQATFSGLLAAYDMSVSNSFKVLGNTTLSNTLIAGNFSIDGTLSITGDSINAIGSNCSVIPAQAKSDLAQAGIQLTDSGSELDSRSSSLSNEAISLRVDDLRGNDNCGILYLQSSPLAQGIDVFNGLVTIDHTGRLTAQTISTNKLVIPDTLGTATAANPTIGSGKIDAGQTSVIISNNQITSSAKIFITPRTKIGAQSLVVESIEEGKSFTVSMNHSISTEVTFDWWIVETRD